jgi:hypothetical protein
MNNNIRVLHMCLIYCIMIDFFISIRDGMVNAVANKMLDFNEVTYMDKSIGEHTIDLRVETILKDNASILDFLEKIKAMDGVKDVVWSEIVSVVGRKISIPSSIIGFGGSEGGSSNESH